MKPLAIILFAFLVIVAGMFLLARTRKDELGRFFKFISYLVVISGFAIILIVIQLSIFRMFGECRNRFSHFGMHKGFNKEMPCPVGDNKMIFMNEEIMDEGNLVRKIEINGDEDPCMMKTGGNNGCGMGPGGMMKIQLDKSCGNGPACDLKCLAPQERAMIITKRISDKVTLSTEQFTKVQALILDISGKREILMKQSINDPIKMDAMMKQHHQESMDALKKLLTAAQIKLLPEDFPL
jgi:hypothetical protein